MESLLTHPVGVATKRRIANYGIELEVLSGNDRGDGYSRQRRRERPEMPPRPRLESYVYGLDCDCSDCYYQRTVWETEVRHYLEVILPRWEEAAARWDAEHAARGAVRDDAPPPGTAKTLAFLEALRRADLTDLDGPHGYHCRCDEKCAPTRSGPHFTAQNDSTVGIEFISRILKAGTADADVVEQLISAYEIGMRWTEFVPQSGASHGNHIHVSNSGMDDGKSPPFKFDTQQQVRHLLDTVMVYGNFEEIADGGVGRLRGYNARPNKPAGDRVFAQWESGSWIGNRGYGTMEFRLWNTPSEPRRIAAHIGMSIALTRWAFKQVIVNRKGLDVASNLVVRDQLFEFSNPIKEVLIDCVPDEFRRDTAPLIERLTFDPGVERPESSHDEYCQCDDCFEAEEDW